MKKFLILFIFFSMLLVSCSSNNQQKAQNPNNQPVKKNIQAKSDEGKIDKPVSKVNGESLSNIKSDKSSDSTVYQTYENEKYRYKVDCPKGWKITDQNKGSYVILHDDSKDFNNMVNISAIEMGNQHCTLETLGKETYNQIKANKKLSRKQIKLITNTIFANNPFNIISLDFSAFKMFEYITIKNNNAYFIVYMDMGGASDIPKIINTFRFTN
ncbi:MAG: hypothetical protein ACM3KR_04780 [Deltaproteobacteria bacterium]